MSLCYGSPRLTGDLDFLTPADLGKITDAFRNDICALNKQGRFVLELVEVLGVGPGFKVLRLICRARSFPGEAAHASLPDTVMLELGQVFHLFRPRVMRDPEEPYPILTNGMHNFMADKITSFLLQEKVGKSRGQDVFDACYMLDRVRFGERDLMMIYHNLSTNLATQEAAPTIAGFDEAILYNRAKESYDRLAFQPGFVPPPFDQLFGKMRNFFRSLPWEHMG
jgi:hypothetical protein